MHISVLMFNIKIYSIYSKEKYDSDSTIVIFQIKCKFKKVKKNWEISVKKQYPLKLNI